MNVLLIGSLWQRLCFRLPGNAPASYNTLNLCVHSSLTSVLGLLGVLAPLRSNRLLEEGVHGDPYRSARLARGVVRRADGLRRRPEPPPRRQPRGAARRAARPRRPGAARRRRGRRPAPPTPTGVEPAAGAGRRRVG